jgi:hypothetical protein
MKNSKTTNKRLVLDPQTVRKLNDNELRATAGQELLSAPPSRANRPSGGGRVTFFVRQGHRLATASNRRDG